VIVQVEDEQQRLAAAATLLNGSAQSRGMRGLLHRQLATKGLADESPMMSKLRLSTHRGSSTSSQSSSLQSTSSIGVDSDAESPHWQPPHVSREADCHSCKGANQGDEEEEDALELSLARLQEEAANRSAHPLRTRTYRTISLDRIRAVPAAA
jgi:hypothetical protein